MNFIKSNRNMPILIYQGFIYNLDSKKNKNIDIRVFRCKKRSKNNEKGCPGSIKIDKNDQIIKIINYEGHEADFFEAEKIVTLYNLKKEAVDNDKNSINIISLTLSKKDNFIVSKLPSVNYLRD
ncbi:hypothetical protein GVAV_000783 [Gurleya vavrai]